MPVIKSDFTLAIDYNEKLQEIDGFIYQPKIKVSLVINGKLYPFKLEPYVDSGATRNLFPADILDTLGITLENQHEKEHVGIGGKVVKSYTHEVDMLVQDYQIKTEIDFSRDHKPPLLGMEKFFSFFEEVSFNMTEKRLELTYINPKHN